MANVDVISLVSSPARSSHVDIFDVPMSSSPLPSPRDLYEAKPCLRTGNRAALISKNATSSFTTAAQLLQKVSTEKDSVEEEAVDAIRKFRVSGVNEIFEEVASAETTKPKTIRRPRAKKVADDAALVEKKPRKSRAQKVEAGIGDDGAVKESPARKPRAKKTDVEKQPKIPKGRVTKTTTTSSSEKKPRKTAKSESIDKSIIDEVDDVSAPLQLEEATRRRRDWTPVKETISNTNITTPGDSEADAAHDGSASGKANGFTDLLGTFGYGDKEIAASKPVAKASGTRKRKLIELDKTGDNTKDPQVIAKVKTVRKKPRTITDLATSAYAVNDEEEIAEKPAPLLQYFPLENEGQPQRTVSRSRSPVKRVAKKGKKTVTVSILLSPESALKQLDKQDYIFGTSSQLAREDSPTLLRDLHQAMLASNQVDEDPFADWRDEPSIARPKGNGQRTSSYEGKRGLWSAASRGLNGDLMEVEVVDLSESPVNLKISCIHDDSAIPTPKLPLAKEDDIWHDIDDLSLSPTVTKSTTNIEGLETEASILAEPEKQSEWQDIDEIGITSSDTSNIRAKPIGPVEAAIRNCLQSSPPKPIRHTVNSPAPSTSKLKSKPTNKSTTSTIPDYKTYTTTKLAREISSYGFKPVKSRDQMIILLERCWLGRQRLANPSVTFELPSSAQPPPPSAQIPKSPKRSRKKAALSEVDGSDADSDLPLSQLPRKRKSRASSPASNTATRRSRSASPRRKVARTTARDAPPSMELQRAMTSAITGAARSADGVSPSWYEKMLLYDPIVIEDLTGWLNGGGLGGVRWDGEVSGKEVKAWCEARSVCCLWKESLRNGRKEKKY